MQIVFWALGVLGVVVVAILLLASTKPSDFVIRRSASIAAPPEKLFALIDDFHAWRKWSPWETLDPDLKRSYAGPPQGKGAVYEWEGAKAGKGRMEIVESTASAKVEIDLCFLAPFRAQNLASFELEPRGDSTIVTWSMRGTRPFMLKVMILFMNMDKFVGRDFEKGLAKMKSAAEV